MSDHVLIFGGKGWIGQQFIELLEQKKITFSLAISRPGDEPDKAVEAELKRVEPSHVISFMARTHGPGSNTIEYLEGGPGKLAENTRDNLYGPWLLAHVCSKLGIHMTYVGTGCIFKYDDQHPIDGLGYTEEDEPNYFGNSYSVVKGKTDKMMHQYDDTVFNARIRLPVNFSNDKRNLITKVVSYSNIYDVPNSITILPDILPIMIDLMINKFTGTLNMTNPGPVRHSQTLELYDRLVEKRQWQIITDDQPEAERMRDSRANCALDTSKLQSMYPDLRPAVQAIQHAVLHVGYKISFAFVYSPLSDKVAHASGKLSADQLQAHGVLPINI